MRSDSMKKSYPPHHPVVDTSYLGFPRLTMTVYEVFQAIRIARERRARHPWAFFPNVFLFVCSPRALGSMTGAQLYIQPMTPTHRKALQHANAADTRRSLEQYTSTHVLIWRHGQQVHHVHLCTIYVTRIGKRASYPQRSLK